MINVITYGLNVKVWWDYNELGCNDYYKIKVNGKTSKTKKTFFSKCNLVPGVDYEISVFLVAENHTRLIGTETVKIKLPERIIDVTKAPYFAKGDGETFNTERIQRAIDDCTEDVEVFFPDGVYCTGALNLHSNVTLHLSSKAVIKGSQKAKDYLPKIKSRFEGTMCECYRSLINCGEVDPDKGCVEKNVKIYGGTIEGGGNALKDDILSVESAAILKQYGLENEAKPPVMYYRTLPSRTRGRLIQISNTENVEIIDCNLRNAPSWNNHFIFCKNVTICGCNVYSRGIWNGDGIDPDSSENCTIFDVKFSTGDDSIAVKSGKNLEGVKIARPTKNVKVFSCKSYSGHGMSIGSEMSGGVKNVSVWDCDFLNTTRGVHIKTNPVRGGYIKDVSVYNTKLAGVVISMKYGDNNDGEPALELPEYENFNFKNITVSGVMKAASDGRKRKVHLIEIYGLEKSKIKNVTIDGIFTIGVPNEYSKTFLIENAENVTIKKLNFKN